MTAPLRCLARHGATAVPVPGPMPTATRRFTTSRRAAAAYGFIGLGRMGYPMAQNLRASIPRADTLLVYDVNADATGRFAREPGGVAVAATVRELAEKSDTIITVLPEPQHVRSVYSEILMPASLSAHSSPRAKRLFIDCSTIDPRSSAEVARQVHDSGQGQFVDAPMSGGVVGAAAGTLTFMLGCSPALVDRCTRTLRRMGTRVLHLGPQTSGLKGKLANNYLLALNNIATAEAMNMGVRWGLDPRTLTDMINTATGRCWPSVTNNPVPGVVDGAPAGSDYVGGFGTALMLKDLGLALQACVDAGIAPQLGPRAHEIYTAANADERCRGRDFSVVYRYLGGKE